MQRKMKMVWSLAFAALATGAFAAAPASVSWDWNACPTKGVSVFDPLEWFDGTNWGGDEPVDSDSRMASFAGGPNAARYVTVDRSVRMADVVATSARDFTTNSTQKLVLVSDHPVLVDYASGVSTPQPNGVMFYADVSFAKTTYPKALIFCGDFATAEGASTSYALATGDPTEFRFDLYANSSNPVREQAGGFTTLTANAGNLTMVAPHGSSEAVVGTWSQTDRSPYIVRAGAPHVLCAGTTVSGEGIPDGTFVKRIFPDGVVELSNCATSTLSENRLTFDAFSPRLSQTFALVSGQDGTHVLRFMKWREEDDYRVTLSQMSTAKAESVYRFDVKENALPATVVLRQAATGMQGKIEFGTCRMELGIEGNAGNPNLTSVAGAKILPAAVATLVVSNGLSATVANVTQFAGELVKEGAGSLTLQLSAGASVTEDAKIVVREGSLTLTGDEEATMKSLAVASGAMLSLPAGGIRCDSLNVAPGGVLNGPGSVTVTKFSEALLDISCTGGAKVLYADTVRHGQIYIEPPPTNVPGEPAVWFDASRLDTLTYSEIDGVNRVSRWNDVRPDTAGKEHVYATPTCPSRLPELNVSADGRQNCVYFQQENSAVLATAYELGWNRQVRDIRCVFKVVGCSKGGGQFLGQSSLWRATENRTFSDPVIYKTLEPTFPPETTRFYVNGERRSWLDGYAYAGAKGDLPAERQVPQVAEMHLDDTTSYAQGFSAQDSTGRNGNQYLYELIVYTNRLTEVERLAVCGYLTKKWLGTQVEYEACVDVETLPMLGAGKTLGVADGTKMAVNTLWGDGTVTKEGTGDLYVSECFSTLTSLKVAGGTALVRSVSAKADALPEGAVLHLDASNADSFLKTRTDGETAYVTEWADTRGEAYGAVRVRGSRNSVDNPILRKEALNGLDMVDVRNFTYRSGDHCLTSGVMTVRSAFSVANTEAGGGLLFGDSEIECYRVQADGPHGLARNPVGSLGYPIVNSGVLNVAGSYGAGASRMLLNGSEVDGGKSYFTGENDLVGFWGYEGLIGNSVTDAILSNSRYGGGKMIGEIIYYSRRLTNEEARRVDAYLRLKWFGEVTPGCRPARLKAIEVAEGATVAVVGGAPLEVSSCAGSGTVSGSLAFVPDSIWNVTVGADGVSSALTVTGTMDVSKVRALALSGTGKIPLGSYVLATAGGIVGDVGSIAVGASAASAKRSYSLRRNGNDIVLDVRPLGLLMIVR